LAILVTVAAFTDILWRRIPNWIPGLALLAAFGLRTYLLGWVGLRTGLLGFGLALLIYLPLFSLRAMGGGDVKLMAAVGAVAGPFNWFVIFVFTSIFGGILALGLLFFRGGLGRALRNITYIMNDLARLRAPHRERPELDVASSSAVTMPHGVAIALGAFLFLVLSRQ
jgi:prepilin peptidase CpaA